MGKRARELATQLEVFHKRLRDFLATLDEQQLSKKLPWEGYPLITVAAHISGPRHYGLVGLARSIIDGREIPDETSQMSVYLANRDFEAHLEWDYQKTIDELESGADRAIAFIRSLKDADLGARTFLTSYGGSLTVEQLLEWILIGTSVEHLENMRREIHQPGRRSVSVR